MPFLCKLMSPLSKNLFFAISQPIIQITEHIRCLDPCFDGQRSLKYHSGSDNVRPKHDNMQSAHKNLSLGVFIYVTADKFRGVLRKCFHRGIIISVFYYFEFYSYF